MIIYGASMSPYVRKVIAVAIEKDVDFKIKTVGRGDRDPEFREASPLGKMPALRDGDYLLSDSSAIAHYLEVKHPDPALYPADARERGRAVWWEEFADTILFGCIAKMFFHRVVAPRFEGKEGDLEMADRAEAEELPPLLDYLESEMSGGEHLVGDTLSIADLALASPFANLDHAGAKVDWSRYPKLDEWTKRMLARPSLAGSVQREQAYFAKIGHEVAGRI